MAKITGPDKYEIPAGGGVVFHDQELVDWKPTTSNKTRPFLVCSIVSGKGSIAREKGMFVAPMSNKFAEVKVLIEAEDGSAKKEVTIKIGKGNHSNKKKKIKLKIGIQQPVKAGREGVQLPIESLNDPNGKKNFTCRIISSARPIGRVEKNGFYWPPFHLDQTEMVEVEVVLSDSSKKIVLDFLVVPN